MFFSRVDLRLLNFSVWPPRLQYERLRVGISERIARHGWRSGIMVGAIIGLVLLLAIASYSLFIYFQFCLWIAYTLSKAVPE